MQTLSYFLIIAGILGFCLIVWGPGKVEYYSGYKGNPTKWACGLGFSLLALGFTIPVFIGLIAKSSASSTPQATPTLPIATPTTSEAPAASQSPQPSTPRAVQEIPEKTSELTPPAPAQEVQVVPSTCPKSNGETYQGGLDGNCK